MTVPSPLRRLLRPLAALAAAATIAACDVAIPDASGPGAQPASTAPVQVALLIPRSDPSPEVSRIAADLENATRLAMAGYPQGRIDLRVYDTAGNTSTAAARAQQAVDEGADVILGPLRGEAANAAGVAVADEGVNVLSFSNNPSIAGGNVYVLGTTFDNTARRLLTYAADQGQDSLVVVHSDDVPGQVGRIAIEQAAARAGLNVLASEAYPLSVEGVAATAQRARASAEAGADTVFITTDATNAAMPMLLQMLPENGLDPATVQYIGLTRWDVKPELYNLPGARGAWFAVPDPSRQQGFEASYAQAYGRAPHPLAGLAYDGITAIAASATRGGVPAAALTQASGFQGATGRFRLGADGTNQRALAIASIQNGQVIIVDSAPSSLGRAGF
ncbi:penicillin-binding protein activator [Citreimonas salinaria]|uniref:Amino acid/amide ABC transporter substrate-binding protein, HAAT family n=1 Tax=Citreimonas salinaria TaxID=321339 RepID=A0A1H3I2F2_9RHOB|nr:penicillin-binding protein activator [Citreimonas salinaria]SDY21883.1 amino acid/amide ABC transporter substrate-binding protein, HAAT family [Citreimonas salinaria]